MLKRIPAVSLLLLLLGACTVGPDFNPPEWLSPSTWFAKKDEPEPDLAAREFDPFAGGFPVPPLPGQELPAPKGPITAGASRAKPVEAMAGASAGTSSSASSGTDASGAGASEEVDHG